MHIKNIYQPKMSEYGKSYKGIIWCIHIKIDDINSRAQELIKSISDSSWINKLDTINQTSYSARAKKTIEKTS